MSRSIIFDILAIDAASPTFSKVGMAAGEMSAKVGSAGAMAGRGFLTAGVAAGALAVKSIEMASNFDAAIVRLQTTAGESHAALGMVSNGLLDMAGHVGYTAQDLAKAMYTVESAGFHGAGGLKVMEAAAKGARVEGADLTTTVDAVSSLLVDYHLKGDAAARVTNILTAAVGHGKTTFEGLAAALPNVAAAGATAHITMAELASAIATMTMHGTDAAKAGTYLRQVIGQLEGPSAGARQMMKGLGIDANHLGLVLSSGSGHGLADAIQMVDQGINQHLTKSGLVAVEMFKKSKGSISDYKKVLADLPPNMVTAFGALSKMVGGVKSLQGFLQLGGENLKTYRANVAAVREQVRAGGKDVEGFAQQQATLSGKLNDAKGATSALAVRIGQDLTPAAMQVVSEFTHYTGVLNANHQTVAEVMVVLTGLAGAVIAVKTATFAAWVATTLWSAAVTVGSAAQATYAAVLGGSNSLVATWIGVKALEAAAWVRSTAAAVASATATVASTTAQVAASVATKAWTAAQWLLNVAMDANPIGLVELAIVALIAAIVLAYKHSETFRNIVHALGNAMEAMGHAAVSAFHWVVNAVESAFNWVRSHWPQLVAILAGPIGIAVMEIIKHWGKVKAFFSVVVGWFSALPGRILGALGDLGHLLFNAGQSVIQGLISGIQSMVGSVVGVLHSITSLIPIHKGPIEKDRMLLHPAGVAIMEGLIHGIESHRVPLINALQKVTSYISNENSQLQSLISSRDSMVSSFQGMSSSAFGQSFSSSPGGVLAGMLAYGQDEMTKALQAQQDVRDAISMGLSKSLTMQLANSGSTGLENLHALVAGGPSAIAQMNAFDAQTSAALTSAGMVAGNSLYGSQIHAAERDKATAVAIRNELEKWRKDHDKHTVVELHIDGRVLQASLLQLKRTRGNQPLGLG